MVLRWLTAAAAAAEAYRETPVFRFSAALDWSLGLLRFTLADAEEGRLCCSDALRAEAGVLATVEVLR